MGRSLPRVSTHTCLLRMAPSLATPPTDVISAKDGRASSILFFGCYLLSPFTYVCLDFMRFGFSSPSQTLLECLVFSLSLSFFIFRRSPDAFLSQCHVPSLLMDSLSPRMPAHATGLPIKPYLSNSLKHCLILFFVAVFLFSRLLDVNRRLLQVLRWSQVECLCSFCLFIYCFLLLEVTCNLFNTFCRLYFCGNGRSLNFR